MTKHYSSSTCSVVNHSLSPRWTCSRILMFTSTLYNLQVQLCRCKCSLCLQFMKWPQFSSTCVWLWLSLSSIIVELTLQIRGEKSGRQKSFLLCTKPHLLLSPPNLLSLSSVQGNILFLLSPVGFPHKTLHPPRRRIPLITDRREHSAAQLGDSTAQHGSFTQHRDSTNCQGMLAAVSSHSGSCK